MIKELFYTTVDGVDKQINLFTQEDNDVLQKKPLVVFFFGGGWKSGSIDQFKEQSIALTQNGFICATVDYRVYDRDNKTLDVIMTDCFSALKYLSDNANELGIDKDKVMLSGGSAGGHLAMSCCLFNNIPNEFTIKGFVLFNGVIDTTDEGYKSEAITMIEPAKNLKDVDFSPYHHIKSGMPDLLMFHGTADKIVKYDRAVEFSKKYELLGNFVEFVSYEDRGHGFFNNYPRNKVEDYEDTLKRAIEFAIKCCES